MVVNKSHNKVSNEELEGRIERGRIRRAIKWVGFAVVPFFVIFIVGVLGAFYGVDAIGDLASFFMRNRDVALFFRVALCCVSVVYLPEIIEKIRGEGVSDELVNKKRLQVVGLYLGIELLMVQGFAGVIVNLLIGGM